MLYYGTINCSTLEVQSTPYSILIPISSLSHLPSLRGVGWGSPGVTQPEVGSPGLTRFSVTPADLVKQTCLE